MTLENKEGRQDGTLEACKAEAAKHEASEQLNVFDKGRMEGPDADSTTHGTVRAVCVSKRKGTRKTVVDGPVTIEAHHGVAEDAHAGDWHRQVSLLAWESIEKARARGLDVKEGDFAENITTEGINLMALPLGTQLKIGDDVLLELSQQGKVCQWWSISAANSFPTTCSLKAATPFPAPTKSRRVRAPATSVRCTPN